MYIEACESGSMMTDLPEDIDGELNLKLSRNPDHLTSSNPRVRSDPPFQEAEILPSRRI